MNMREEFEVWAKAEWPQTSLNRCDVEYSHSVGQYVCWEVECCWRAWQASRASIEVPLPETCHVNDDEGYFHPNDHSRWLAVDQVIEAVESLGIKVKP